MSTGCPLFTYIYIYSGLALIWFKPPSTSRALVEILVLAENGIGGTLPASLQNLTALQFLDCSTNFLMGTLPPLLGTQLTFLSLAMNQMTGSIPEALGQWTLVQELHLGENLLTGTLPTGIGNLKALRTLFHDWSTRTC